MPTIEEPEFLSPREVAEVQLDRALDLFLNELDYVSAIRLAGAAEEILGKLVEADGGASALGSLIAECVETGDRLFNAGWKAKDFSEIFTYPRNQLKHLTPEPSVAISRPLATSILGRAVSNYESLVGTRTARMNRFMEEEFAA